MRVRAVAVATERSNAVGTVELECTPRGLLVAYLGVGAFSEGYAPGALTTGTSVLVPWLAVTEARVDAGVVFLALEPALTPHNRLTLTNFSTGDRVHERELAKQRWVVRIGALGAAAVLAILAGIGVARVSPGVGAAVAIAIGVFAASLVLAVGLLAENRLGLFTLSSEAVQRIFAASLATYLPQVPVSNAPTSVRHSPFVLPSFIGLLPRTTLAVVITLTAGMLGAVLSAKYIVSDGDERLARLEALERRLANERPSLPASEPVRAAPPREQPHVSAAMAAKPAAPKAPPSGDAARVVQPCMCHRADSPLWAAPIPRLSLVILSKKSKTKEQHQEIELELAAINNGDQDLKELALLVQFFERDPPPSSKRYSVANRPLYYEGPLAPGSAIKWSIEARGREFELENPILGDLGPGGDSSAPANVVVELSNANHRPVRMHGAMLLAYLGDPRAREAALKLKEALRDEEMPYLDRILSAVADVRACDLEVSGQGAKRTIRACVYNNSSETKSDIGLGLRALGSTFNTTDPLGEPPNILSEHKWTIPGKLDPQAGVRVDAAVELPEGSLKAAAFEVLADRFDLLR